MSKYQIWDGKSDIYTPSGAHFTAAEWAEKFPWSKIPGAKMIITGGIINGGAAMEFGQTVSVYKSNGAKITDNMTDEEILTAIEEFEANPPGAGDPTAEERAAAALEFLAISGLPDNN